MFFSCLCFPVAKKFFTAKSFDCRNSFLHLPAFHLNFFSQINFWTMLTVAQFSLLTN